MYQNVNALQMKSKVFKIHISKFVTSFQDHDLLKRLGSSQIDASINRNMYKWMSGPQGRPHPVVYLISVCIVPPCACVLFAVLQHVILVLEDSVSWCFLPSNLTAGFLLQGLFLQAATLALGRQVGCSSTLGCDCSCSSLAPWAPSLHL